MHIRRASVLAASLAGAIAMAASASASTTVSHPITTARATYSHNAEHEYFNIYTETGGAYSSALELTERDNVYLPAFTVERATTNGVYPNLGQGAERGMRPDNSWTPVRANEDNLPYVHQLTTHLTGGTYNAGFDVWFEPSKDTWGSHQGDGGTELMIWTAAHRPDGWALSGPGTYLGTVTIDGMRWNVNAGLASRGGDTWHRIYFAATHPITSFHGALNPFFGQAIKDRQLAHGWWLTGIDYGFEIDSTGVKGLAVTSYQLSGVSDSPAREEYGA